MLLILDLRIALSSIFLGLTIVACSSSDEGLDTISELFIDEPADSQPASIEALGDDIDSDGIRDDVQMMIESEYGGDLEVMRAFKSMAIIDRRAFELAHDIEQLRILANDHWFLLHCLY